MLCNNFFLSLACMSAAVLCKFFEKEIQDCFDKKLMMSLHMKATMMKVRSFISICILFKNVTVKYFSLVSDF